MSELIEVLLAFGGLAVAGGALYVWEQSHAKQNPAQARPAPVQQQPAPKPVQAPAQAPAQQDLGGELLQAGGQFLMQEGPDLLGDALEVFE